jgi:hypothetical protein
VNTRDVIRNPRKEHKDGESMKRSNIKLIITLILILLLGLYLYRQSGYSFSETKAIKKPFPYDNGVVVSEQRFKNDKVVIWKGQYGTYANLIHIKWNFLYQFKSASALSSIYPDGNIKRTWSAKRNSNNNLDTMLAVEVADPQIKKVIITNENIDSEISNNLDEIKKISNIFIEITILNGYGSLYVELDPSDVGAFVFRGIDENGIIKYVGR